MKNVQTAIITEQALAQIPDFCAGLAQLVSFHGAVNAFLTFDPKADDEFGDEVEALAAPVDSY